MYLLVLKAQDEGKMKLPLDLRGVSHAYMPNYYRMESLN